MKCASCDERNGSTRCEGCQTLFCLPCITKHHDELLQQFQQLMDSRNEVKEALDTAVSTLQDEKTVSCIADIDQWEKAIIQRIRQMAARARTNVHEILTKSMGEIHVQFEKLSVEMQQRQKEGNYLENDINNMRSQLEKLKNAVLHVKEKVTVDTTGSNNVEWESLMYVIEGEQSAKTEHWPPDDYIKIPQRAHPPISRKKQLIKTSLEHSDTSDTVAIARALPVESTSSNSTQRTLIDLDPATPPIHSCILCRQSFFDSTSTDFCPECEFKNNSPTYYLMSNDPRNNSTPIQVHRSNQDFATPIKQSPRNNIRIRSPMIWCPNCKQMNMINKTLEKADFNCTVCGVALRMNK